MRPYKINKSLFNKKIFVVLLVALAFIIWGNFFFQLNNDKPSSDGLDRKKSNSRADRKNKEFPKNDLSSIERDPFKIETIKVQASKPLISREEIKDQNEVEKIPHNLKKIRYIGLIDSTALVNVNNDMLYLNKGDECLEFKVLRIEQDSLILHYKKDYIIISESVIELQ